MDGAFNDALLSVIRREPFEKRRSTGMDHANVDKISFAILAKFG